MKTNKSEEKHILKEMDDYVKFIEKLREEEKQEQLKKEAQKECKK